MVDRVRRATIADVDALAPLFDDYRRFYRQPADLALARAFLAERLGRDESVIYLAERDGRGVGFVQLYPAFSSTAARPRRSWILNDLFVAPEARRSGIAQALLAAARRLAEETDAAGLELLTARTNRAAQQLYQALGWRLDDEYLRYELSLDG
jgi:GNAT superfamily N-acetyltransferase